MTAADSGGTASRAATAPLSSGATQLLLLASALAILNATISRATEISLQEGIVQSLYQGGGQSWIIWCTFMMAIHLALSVQASCQRWTIPIWLWPLILLMLVPLANVSWLAAILISLLALLKAPLLQQRAAAAILLALSVRVPAAQSVFLLLSEQVLGFDAWLASIFVSLIHQAPEAELAVTANVITGPNGMQLLILTGCSAFTNLSLLLLLWFSINRYLCWHSPFRQWWWLVPVALASLLINTVRLGMMSFNQTYYEVIHNGWAASLFDLAQLIATLAISILGVCYEKNYQACNASADDRDRRAGDESGPDPEHAPGS